MIGELARKELANILNEYGLQEILETLAELTEASKTDTFVRQKAKAIRDLANAVGN